MAPIARRPWASFIVKLFLSVSLLVSILTANLYLLLSPNYIVWQYSRPPLKAEITAADKAKALTIVDYLRNRTGRLPILTHKERAHLADVRGVFNLAFVLFKLTMAVLIAAWAALSRLENRAGALRQLAVAAALDLAVLMGFLAAMVLNFNRLFTWFHRLFFSGDSWIFASDSALIRLFPLEFWTRAGLHWVSLTMFELAVLAVGAVFIGRLKFFGQLDAQASGDPRGQSHIIA